MAFLYITAMWHPFLLGQGNAGRILKACAASALLFSVCCTPAYAWPEIALPKGLTTFRIADSIAINGLPMRLQGFVSSFTPDELGDKFRLSLGKPFVESKLAQTLILGRAQGDYYVSIHIEAAGKGSRGTVVFTDLQAASEAQPKFRSSRQQWLSRMPPGTRLVSLTNSQDGSKLSHHLVFTNRQDERMNQEYLSKALADEALVLERAVSAEGTQALRKFTSADSRTLFYKGSGRDAVATISKDGVGQTVTVLSLVTIMDRYK